MPDIRPNPTPAPARRPAMPARMRGAAAALAVFATLAVAGCGDEDGSSQAAPNDFGTPDQIEAGGSGGEALAADDVAEVLTARRAIDASCRAGSAPVAADIEEAVDTLVLVLRNEGPNRVYEVGSGGEAERMTVVVDRVRAQLETCDARDQSRRLARWADVESPGALGGG